MDWNPYESPQAETRAKDPAELPLWRHVVSVSALFFGICYLGFAISAILIGPGTTGTGIQSAILDLTLGGLLTWGGARVRRTKTDGKQTYP
jgi:hypothetical protein